MSSLLFAVTSSVFLYTGQLEAVCGGITGRVLTGCRCEARPPAAGGGPHCAPDPCRGPGLLRRGPSADERVMP